MGGELELTQEQREVVHSSSRAIVVLAGAGSGKTEAIARRVLRLLETSTSPGRVLALAYTNKAADELRERLQRHAGVLVERVTTETVHGFAHGLLRQHGSRLGLPMEPELLARDEDRAELMARWRASEGLPPNVNAVDVLRQIDLDRARLKMTEDIADWRRALASLPAIDYAGLLDAASELLEFKSVRRQLARTYDHVIVDEAQNLTPAQYRLIDSVLGEPGTGPAAMLVGDDKQSIVSFAGADPRLLTRFAEERSAKIIRLEHNFRSARVLSVLGSLVAQDLDQGASSSAVHAAPGAIELLEARDEAEEGRRIADWVEGLLTHGLPRDALASSESAHIRPEEIAILGRSATALRGTTTALVGKEIAFAASSTSADWMEGATGQIVTEIVALKASPEHVSTQWRLSRILELDEASSVSVEQVEQTLSGHSDAMVALAAHFIDADSPSDLMKRIDDVIEPEAAAVEELAAWRSDSRELRQAWHDFTQAVDREARTWINFRMFCSRRQRGSSSVGVQLLTVHKAQGREFKAVAVVGMNEGQIPDFRAKSGEARISELRTFYVAVTRSRRLLLLSRALQRSTRYGERATTPSPYLEYAKRAIERGS